MRRSRGRRSLSEAEDFRLAPAQEVQLFSSRAATILTMSRPLLSPAGLWHSLFDTGQNKFAYLGKALLLDLPVCLAVAVVIGLLSSEPGPDFSKYGPAELLFLLGVFAPLIETGMMMLIFGVLRWFTKREPILIALSVVIWALLHSASHPLWGAGIAWPFLLFSVCYLNWGKRSRSQAYLMTAAFHGLHNLFAVLLLLSRAVDS